MKIPGKSTSSDWYRGGNAVDSCYLEIEMTKELYSVWRLKIDTEILY